MSANTTNATNGTIRGGMYVGVPDEMASGDASLLTLNKRGGLRTEDSPTREGAVLHRDAVTAADKLAVPAMDTLVDVTTQGALLANTNHKASTAAGNRWGPTTAATADNKTTAADASNTHQIRIPIGQVTGADHYDVFLSTDANPKWVGRITEAQRAAGCAIRALGVVSGDGPADVAGKIRTALNADAALTALYTVGGTGAAITLTRTSEVANDASLNVNIANGTCTGLTAAPASADTTAGVAAVLQIETATIVGEISTSGDATITVTAAGMPNTPKAVSVAVLQGVSQVETGTVVGEITTTGNAEVIVTAPGMANSPKTLNVAVLQGVQQVETATVVGTITTTGNAKFTVTAVGMPNTPKDVSVAVSQGVLQVETGTVVGEISTTGNATVIVTANGMANSPKTLNVAVLQGTQQVETATIVGEIATSGNAKITVAAAGMPNTPKDVSVAVLQGVAQVTTAEIVGTITGAGDASITVTAAGMPNTPKLVSVAVLLNDTASDVAGKVRTALDADPDVGPWCNASGANQYVVLTRVDEAANDVTFNIAVANGTCTGLTEDPLSADTTAGVAPDDASAVAGKCRTALNNDVDVSGFFTVGGAGADIVLTKINEAADDVTLNIASDNDTCTGLTPDATSTDTTAGVAPDDAAAVGGKIRTDLGLDVDVTGWFTVGGAGANVVLTRLAEAANDGTMNVSIDNGTCAGLTPALTSANTTAGEAADTASAVATKARTALSNDGDVSGFFNVSGAGADVVLTAIVEAANGATMNLAFDNDTCAGLVADLTSTDTTAGVAPDDASAVAGKIRTDLGLDGDVTAFFTVGGAGANVTLTAIAEAANEVTMNLSIDNGTCAGLTPALTSANTTAGVAPDDASAVAGKARTALGLDADVSGFFTISGSGANIILTAITDAADDVTMNIASTNGTCAGLTPQANSTDTTAGVLGVLQVETATVVGSITGAGNATVIVTASGLAGSPKTYSVAVVFTGAVAGAVDVGVVGTGVANNAAPFTVNNAYRPATVTAIDCSGKSTAHCLLKLAVTDLRSAPSLRVVPFTANTLSANDWHMGAMQTISLLGDNGQALEQAITVDVQGSTGLALLIDVIAGQGAALSAWVELS